MPSLRLRYDINNRPIVSVEGKPGLALQRHFQMHPPNVVPRFVADFLIDTGATGCWVEEDLLESWHLMKMLPILTQSGMSPTVAGHSFPLSLRLQEQRQPDSWYHPLFSVGTVPAGHFKGFCRGLIGMDLLRLGVFHYDGPTNSFDLTWR